MPTGFTCELKFRRLLSDDVIGYGGPEWPFTGTAPDDATCGSRTRPGGRLSRGGTLRPERRRTIFKYDVAWADGRRTPPPPLDPIIIIER